MMYTRLCRDFLEFVSLAHKSTVSLCLCSRSNSNMWIGNISYKIQLERQLQRVGQDEETAAQSCNLLALTDKWIFFTLEPAG